MKAVISGYGRMGKAVEKILAGKGLECVGKSEDIAAFDPAVAADATMQKMTRIDAPCVSSAGFGRDAGDGCRRSKRR